MTKLRNNPDKTKTLRLSKGLVEQCIAQIPFTKSQLTEIDNVLFWYALHDSVPKPLQNRVQRIIEHIRIYSL